MKFLTLIISFLLTNGCAIYNTATSCNAEYNRYIDWKEHLDKAETNYNIQIEAGNLTSEQKNEFELDIIDLQINVNESLLDFQDCKMRYIQENELY
jgi:hypothetical protein